MRVGIDLDGVCHDLIGSYRRFLGDVRHPDPTPDPTEWDFSESWGISRERFLDDLRLFADDIFNGEMLPGTADALGELYASGHDIHFITHRPAEAKGITFDWLMRHGLQRHHVHFVEHKHDVPVDIHLDDHLETANAMAEAGIRSFLFDRPWNQGTIDNPAVGIHRVRSWEAFLSWVRMLADTPPPATTPKAPPMPIRTPEQHEILGTFLTLLEGPTGDGGTKRARGEKPSWKVDTSHLGAAFRHLDPSRERYDEDSGCHKHVHAAWRLLADAYQDMVADGKIPGDPQ